MLKKVKVIVEFETEIDSNWYRDIETCQLNKKFLSELEVDTDIIFDLIRSETLVFRVEEAER